MERIPAFVIGDGSSSVKELISRKNRERKLNPHTSFRPIVIDDTLEGHVARQGFSLSSVPAQGEEVILRGNANLSSGGESVDRTDDLPQEILDAAVKAVGSVPGLTAAGVDLLYDDTQNENGYIIIEINSDRK